MQARPQSLLADSGGCCRRDFAMGLIPHIEKVKVTVQRTFWG